VPSGTDTIKHFKMRTICLAFAVLLTVVTAAQNLVPNPSFEEYDQCPNWISQLDFVSQWSTAGITPDYFNACSTVDEVEIPQNAVGHQWPAGGNGYVGAMTGPAYYKEYIQARLLEPLIPGVTTYVSFMVSPGGDGVSNSVVSPTLFADHLGLRVSVDSLEADGPGPLDEFELLSDAVVFAEEVLSDTASWTVLSGSFVPDSAYRYVQLGNFYPDSVCSYLVFGDTLIGGFIAYAFIDMVCVSQEPGVCDTRVSIETFDHSARRTSQVFERVLRLHLGDWFRGESPSWATLYDYSGRIVAKRGFAGRDEVVDWELGQLPNGGYLLLVTSQSGQSIRMRVLKSTL
jgi:hypothetical protein